MIAAEELYAAVGGLVAHRMLSFRVGRRLVVAPAWLRPPSGTPDFWIRLDQSQAGDRLDPQGRPLTSWAGRPTAFGTGQHPTTRLALCALEDALCAGETVLDLGTGSGVLAVAAAVLGAGAVLALDPDLHSVDVARGNVALNGVQHRVCVERGSLAQALGRGFRADLVLANILTPVVVGLLQEGLVQVLAGGGMLVVSGVRAAEVGEMGGALRAAGLDVLGQQEMAGWAALVARRQAAPGDDLI